MVLQDLQVSDSIPIDLVLEILSRVPAKSVDRFRSLSKLWESLLSGPYFTELFLTNSYDRPRLLFALERDGEWFFYSTTQPQNPYAKSSGVVADAAVFHMKLSEGYTEHDSFGPVAVSGLIYIPNMRISEEATNNTVNVICNPSTAQFVILPKSWTRSFLGFDPIDKQFKVLSLGDLLHDHEEGDTEILTLGTGKLNWRKIQCPLIHHPYNQEICINGVLYYLAIRIDTSDRVIACFDVNSEKFRFIDMIPFFNYRFYKLVNYKGKLGHVNWRHNIFGGRYTLELTMWVLEDVEKQEWSKYNYILPRDHEVFGGCYLFVHGVTRAGEIVLSMNHRTSKPFYVLYFNPERNTLRSVKIQGFPANLQGSDKYRIYTFVDHREDLKFNA